MDTVNINLANIEKEIKELLQLKNIHQELDSLEIIVIQSFLKSIGFNNVNKLMPINNTIKGWIICLRQYLMDGKSETTN